jgi:signal transduction histidine kinase
MYGVTQPASFFAVPPTSRLRWLVQLRWLALSGVALGLLVARAARLPWVKGPPIALAVAVGVLYNLGFLWRLRRLERRALRDAVAQASAPAGELAGEITSPGDISTSTITALAEAAAVGASSTAARRGRRGLWYLRRFGDRMRAGAQAAPATGAPTIHDPPRRARPLTPGRELELQVLADVAALTLLLLACGGARNPICMFYGFHVVIGAMLGYVRGALLAAGVGLLGLGFLVGAEHAGLLLSPPLLSPPLWLTAGTAVLTVACLAYFSLGVLRFVEREQGRALRNYDLLLAALDTLQVGLELVAPDGKLLLANRRAATLHPCPDGQWTMPEGLAASGPETGEGAGSEPHRRRLAHTERGETRIYELLALAGWQADDLRAFIYVDRTEGTVNEQRAIMLEQLASLGRAMQQVAHELNTPLASIQTLAVDLSHAQPGPDAAESIALIIDEARRCREISRELLSTARLGEHSPVRTVLADVVRRAARLAYGRQTGRGRVTVHGELDLACVTDGDRLLQILVNLLQNASDASDQPVEVTVSADPARAILEVRDHGPGLPDEVRRQLFAPFISTKPKGKGTGLGLYTCARLAQQLHAELTIDNATGGGVLARLVLPRN